MHEVIAVVVRAVVVVALAALTAWLVDLGDESVGANIGAGLLAFVIVIVVTLLWSLLDGRRSARFGPTFLRWLAVGVLVGVASAVMAQGLVAGLDAGVLSADFIGLTPFVIGLVGVPAAIGTGVGVLLGRHRRA
ncbi:hypothetical protein [Mobilicoccus massiliensis]|uniref:hypothetical protein n=1 Tax=Mobilicoccus massiliensis TaxID=1522310 RepID=UPI000590EAD4|nr:hypothetical protein [Mobilicoccus massiliensis]